MLELLDPFFHPAPPVKEGKGDQTNFKASHVVILESCSSFIVSKKSAKGHLISEQLDMT